MDDQVTINILGYDIVFYQDTCKTYQDIVQTIATTAPEEALNKFNNLPKEELIDLMSDIWLELEAKLDVPIPGTENIDWNKAVENAKKEEKEEKKRKREEKKKNDSA